MSRGRSCGAEHVTTGERCSLGHGHINAHAWPLTSPLVVPMGAATSEGAAAHSTLTASALIRRECSELADFLVEKNRKYGNSALEPIGVFSKASAEELILARIDDKLSRLRNGVVDDEDTVLDLLGYLILLRVHRRTVKP